MDVKQAVQEAFPGHIVYERQTFVFMDRNGPHQLDSRAVMSLISQGIAITSAVTDSTGTTYTFDYVR